MTQYPNGTTTIWSPPPPKSNVVEYYSNGKITIHESPENNFFTAENGSERISKVEPYSAVLAKNPLNCCSGAAQSFVNRGRSTLEWIDNQSITLFTSDYALYWWDYLSGYDLVLAELGWNNTVAQEIGLVRGAASLQDKSWGTIITWTHTQSPYLASGDEVFDQMRLSYECGADYVVVFNYAKDLNGPYGTLLEEHFRALDLFWREVVKTQRLLMVVSRLR
jgi:hypothetical protein